MSNLDFSQELSSCLKHFKNSSGIQKGDSLAMDVVGIELWFVSFLLSYVCVKHTVLNLYAFTTACTDMFKPYPCYTTHISWCFFRQINLRAHTTDSVFRKYESIFSCKYKKRWRKVRRINCSIKLSYKFPASRTCG